MPENEMNPDPVFDKLVRFSPSSGGLDRDAILFASGRASARSRRIWPAIAGFLAVTQAITLAALLMPRSPREMPTKTEIPATSSPMVEPRPEYPSDGMIQVWSDPDRLPKESPVADPAPPEPVWTVLSAKGLSLD
jgi:hypothetical protein